MPEPTALPSTDTPSPLIAIAERHAGCGGVFNAITVSKTEKMVGLTATVERKVSRCDRCDAERRGPDEVEGDYLATMAAIRDAHGLLTPQEIRRTREALGVTPDEFDQLLGLPSGISKGWETLRHLQNAAADARIRALQDVEYAQKVAIGARVTLRLTEEERATMRTPAFLRKKGGARSPMSVAQDGGAATEGDAPGANAASVAASAPAGAADTAAGAERAVPIEVQGPADVAA